MRTYVVEPQQIFAPSLLALLQESGYSIVRAASALDPLDVVRARPEMLVFDADSIDEGSLRGLRFIADSMPQLDLCVYARSVPSELQRTTRLLHLSKSAPHEELCNALREFSLRA
ncbi:MAG: hypothetical protein ACREMP_03800 [Candidatus Tyrphobacter sp.]